MVWLLGYCETLSGYLKDALFQFQSITLISLARKQLAGTVSPNLGPEQEAVKTPVKWRLGITESGTHWAGDPRCSDVDQVRLCCGYPQSAV